MKFFSTAILHAPGRTAVALLLLLAAGTFGAAPALSQDAPTQAPQYAQSQAYSTAMLAKSQHRNTWVRFPNDGASRTLSGSRNLKGWVVYPDLKDGAKAPVVLVLHEVFGLTDSTRNTADEIAAMGYIAIAPDMLAGLGPNGGDSSSFTRADAPNNRLTGLDDRTVMSDLDSWSKYGLSLPESNGKLAIVGLTWGGGSAFRYAIFPGHNKALKAIYVFCGLGPYHAGTSHEELLRVGFNPPLDVTTVNVPVHGYYAGEDPRVMWTVLPTKKAMDAAKKPFDYVVYKGAEHAFLRVGYDPKNKITANMTAIKASEALLQKQLQQDLK